MTNRMTMSVNRVPDYDDVVAVADADAHDDICLSVCLSVCVLLPVSLFGCLCKGCWSEVSQSFIKFSLSPYVRLSLSAWLYATFRNSLCAVSVLVKEVALEPFEVSKNAHENVCLSVCTCTSVGLSVIMHVHCVPKSDTPTHIDYLVNSERIF